MAERRRAVSALVARPVRRPPCGPSSPPPRLEDRATLPGCHTPARSLDELMARMKEAIQLCLEVQGDTSEKLDFVGVQRVRLAS
jgi:hypothetical protein